MIGHAAEETPRVFWAAQTNPSAGDSSVALVLAEPTIDLQASAVERGPAQTRENLAGLAIDGDYCFDEILLHLAEIPVRLSHIPVSVIPLSCHFHSLLTMYFCFHSPSVKTRM
jgi:hypothetical protein